MFTQNKKQDTMTCVHRAWSLFQAKLAVEALRSEGIEAMVRNQRLVTSIGLIPPQDAMVEVWAEKDHAERATHIIHEIFYGNAAHPIVGKEHTQDSPKDAKEPTHCPYCGAPWETGYDACWKCCRHLPS